MSNLYFTIGSARCGKSTYSKQWQKEHPSGVIVSGDQIRLSLHGNRYSSWAEGFTFAIQQVMVRTLLNSGYDVLIDDTNTTKESVMRILEIDPDATATYFGNVEKELCKERAIKTNQPDLLSVIELHYDNMNRVLSEYGSYQELIKHCREEIKRRWKSDFLRNIVIPK